MVPPADGWKGSRRTSRTQMCTITPWLARATSTGASSSPSITSWLRRRSWSLKKSPCSPGMRLNIRFLLVSRCRSGTPTTSLPMTSWVRGLNNYTTFHLIWHNKNAQVSPSFLSLTITAHRCDWVGPKPVPSRRQDGQAVFPWHDPKRARAAHHFYLQTKEGQGLVAVCRPRWERWDGANG